MGRKKYTDIPRRVKDAVWERDRYCVYCGSPYGQPNAHYIPRSLGGLGIEENILTLCWECHDRYDHSTEREEMREFFESYLKSLYPNWSEDKLIYKKWGDNN